MLESIFCQIVNSHLIFRWRRMIFNHCSKKALFAPLNGSPNRLSYSVFPCVREVLTVAMLLTYLPLLVGRLFQRCHLSRIDEVKCGDFMTKPHMLSQIPPSCPCTRLLLLATVPRILIGFLRLMCRFCFTRIILNTMSGKILYHHSVSVIVSGFASLIKDFVICRYQVTKLFCCGKKLRQCVFCKKLSLFWFLSRRRNFGCEWRYYVSSTSLPLS